MRMRHQTGGLRKQRGRWIGMWWSDSKRKSRVLGFVRDMTKSEARAAIGRIVAEEQAKRQLNRTWHFGEFVKTVYLPFYCRKWKASTVVTNKNRVETHLCEALGSEKLSAINREELQELLDRKAQDLSFSIVDHLRWDMKQIFDMALAEGHIQRNPAFLIWTPRESRKPVRNVMTMEDVQTCFRVLAPRERLIVKLAILAGMRPGEIFALTWGQMGATFADIRQRVYRGIIDTPKTDQSFRKAALSEGLIRDVEEWRASAVSTEADAWVFPSERMTPLVRENVWRRHMDPKLRKVGLAWANFQVMRRTHSTLMNALGVDGKLVADQLGHTLDVNQNVYTQSAVATRQIAVNQFGNIAKRSSIGVLRSGHGRKLLKILERETGIEPATFSLGS